MCDVDARLLPNDFIGYSAHRQWQPRGVSSLAKRSLDMRVDLGYVGAEGRLVVTDISVKKFRSVYVSNDQGLRVGFFHRLGSFLVDSSRLVLMGD